MSYAIYLNICQQFIGEYIFPLWNLNIYHWNLETFDLLTDIRLNRCRQKKIFLVKYIIQNMRGIPWERILSFK